MDSIYCQGCLKRKSPTVFSNDLKTPHGRKICNACVEKRTRNVLYPGDTNKRFRNGSKTIKNNVEVYIKATGADR